MRGEESSKLIYVENLSKSFGRNKVIINTNFELRKGEILGFVGPSGSGKSVFLKILIGFLKADKGKVWKHKSMKIGFSSQENPLYPYLTVEQNLNYFSKINNIGRKKRKHRIESLINKLNLQEYKKTIFKNLSGGTKKRVDLACSLLENPEILILDEPFVGLDPGLVEQLSRFIDEINRSGVTIIISSHRISELSRLCHRFIELENKRIVTGTTHETRRSIKIHDI